MEQSLFSKERLSDVINLSLLEEYLNRLYNDIQVPFTLFDIDGEIITYSPCIDLCKEIICKDPRMHILCKETCASFNDNVEELFFCPNGLMKYRIPLCIDNEIVAYIVMRQFLTEQDEVDSIKNMLIKRGFDYDSIRFLSSGIPILHEKKLEKIITFINEFMIITANMSNQDMKVSEKEEKVKKNYRMLMSSFEEIDK